MKTFVLLFSILFGNINSLFTSSPMDYNLNCSKSKHSVLGNNPTAASFQLLAGNTQLNIFKKVLFHQNYYYVIGSNGNKATLNKFDDLGTMIWTAEVNDTSSWNDFVINTSGNLLVVGSKDINGGLPKDVLVGVFDQNGNALRLFSYNYGINESFNSIVENPIKINAAVRYVVLGSINPSNNRNDDDVILTAMDEWGIQLETKIWSPKF